MKKNRLIICLALISCPFVMGQKVDNKTKKDVLAVEETDKKITYVYPKVNHWSLSGHAGVSFLDGDQSQDYNTLWPRSKAYCSFGFDMEYTFTPILGLYAQYTYIPCSGSTWYWVTSSAGSTNFAIDFDGLSHEVNAGLSLNVLNMFYRYRSQTWSLYVNAGAGIAFYDVTAYERGTQTVVDKMVAGQHVTPSVKNGRTMVLPIGFTLEYNPLKWLAVVWNTQYRMHSRDDLDASTKGRSGDNAIYSGLGLRWKLNNPKDKTIQHVRNMSVADYELIPCCDLTLDNTQKIEELIQNISVLADQNEILNNQITQSQTDLPDSDLDGVPDARDKYPNTPAGSFVNYSGEPLSKEAMERIVGSNLLLEEPPAIYFDLGSTSLTMTYHIELAKIARKMYANPNLKLDIVGYCDNVGGDILNNQLSIQRAEDVKRVLVRRYGIAADRIRTYGKGKTPGPVDDFAPNRRCDLIIVKE